MKSIKIKLQKKEELTPQFMDLFSKVIINSAESISGIHYDQKTEMKYSQLSQYLNNSSHLKHNGMKSQNSKISQSLSFDFQSKTNNVIFLLDLSPYMLIYNYGSKSFPLKNMQQIIIFLLKKLAHRQLASPEYQYNITIYLFSIYKKQLEIVLLNQLITKNSLQSLLEFINLTIQKSNLPYIKESHKYGISQLLQNVFNSQQSNIGLRSLIVISSFNEQEQNKIMLFTPNWYTYTFINTGGNFGSYIIQTKQLYKNLIPGICFKTKYVFQSNFLSNWQMTDIVKSQKPDITKPITEKFRCIQFQNEGQLCKDIFQYILVFRIQLKGLQVNKRVNGAQSVISVISNIKDNPNKIVYKSYKIPAESFIYILRTRYMQGWEPVMISSNSMAVQNSKCIYGKYLVKLRMPIQNQNFLYYEAFRVKNSFLVQIYQILKLQNNKEYSSTNERNQFMNMIQKMDKLNSFNFVTIINENLKINYKSKQNLFNNYLFHQNNQIEVLNYLCNYREWGKFFKIKRTCFKFQPQITQSVLDEFINQITFILGKRISPNIFLKQTELQKKNVEKLEEFDYHNRRVMLTKMNIFGNIVELEMAFLRCTFKEINSTLQSLKSKVNGRKFKKDITTISAPSHIPFLYKNNEISNRVMFNKKWLIKFKTNHYRNIFNTYWNQFLKKMSFEQIIIKSSPQVQKKYYKIIQIFNQFGQKIQKTLFFKISEIVDKHEMIFQVSIPPSFSMACPKNKKNKPVLMQELLNMTISDLKKTQQEIIKMIDTYLLIHYKLLKSSCVTQPKAFNKQLQLYLTSLYDNRTCAFALDFGWASHQIIARYYSEPIKQKYKVLPTPNKLLMTTELQQIEGDFRLQQSGKVYTFFLCSPFKFIYLYKKDKNIYYKFVNIYYVEFNHRQNQPSFLQLILKSIIYRINEQTYVKDFNIFLGGNFKGGILKIINNQMFTQLLQRKTQLYHIFEHCQKYYITSVARRCLQQVRLGKFLQIFSVKMFKIIHQFFPELRVNYYFQIRKSENEISAPFQIDTNISRTDTSLFMRFLFNNGTQLIDITPQNLPELFVKYNREIIAKKASILFEFYLKAKDNNQKSLVFVNYFQEVIKSFLMDASYEVQRVLITKRETLSFHLQNFVFLKSFKEQNFQQIQLKLISSQFQKMEILCKYIEDPVMQHEFPFKKVRSTSNQYMLIKQEIKQKNIIYVQEPFLMKPAKGKLLFYYGFKSKFFVDEHQRFLTRMSNQYVKLLANFINANILIKQLQMTYELPIQPYELWLNQAANHISNKIIQDNKKKMKKNPMISKYLLKEKKSIGAQNDTNSLGINPSVPKVKLSMLYRDFIPLNDRILPNKSLSYLGQYQIFNFNLIRNLKNTYYFHNFQNNHIVFHFQQREDENLIRQILKENKQSRQIKSKKFLIYYAFGLNPLLQKKQIEPLILKHINQVLQKQLFDDVTRFLILHPTPIQQFQQNFIRRKETEEKKEFKIQLPNFFHRDHIVEYIIQHIQIYHYRVQFKSQLQKNKNQASPQFNKFIDSVKCFDGIRLSEGSRIQQSTNTRQSFMQKRKSEKEDSSEFSSYALSHFERRTSNYEMISHSTPSSNSILKSAQSFMNDYNFSSSFQSLEYTWLFNCQRPKQSLIQKYGKCLYFLKIKVRESYIQVLQRQTLQLDKSTYLFTFSDNRFDSNFFQTYLNLRYSGKNTKRQSSSKPMIKFEIIDYVNNPQFNKIEDTFRFIVKSCVGETYIQNYLNAQYKKIKKDYFEFKQAKRIIQNKQKQIFLFEKTWPSIVEIKHQFQEIIEKVDSISFFKYKSDPRLIIKQKLFYFLNCLQQVNEVLDMVKGVYKEKQQFNIPILVYAKSQEKGYICELGSFSHIQKLKDQVNLLFYNQKLTKIGFIVTDYLSAIKNLVSNPTKSFVRNESCQQASFTLNDMKFFKDCFNKDNQDFKFKRSCIINYQITDEGFFYGSYNIKTELDEEIKDYLSAIDCWLSQKSRLFSLIQNIKQNNIYEVGYNRPKIEKKIDQFYRLRKEEESEKKQKNKLNITMYRMLINLIFKELPETIDKSQGNTRYKYVHHHSQVEELISILKDSPIDYKKYPPYKGNQKFIFEKIGRQYISILRQQYRIT